MSVQTESAAPERFSAAALRSTGWALVVGGVIGLLASAQLIIDKLRVLADPDYSPICNINPVLSCGSVLQTEQAEAFGFPNPLIGVVGFSVVITIGVLALAGVSLPRWVWLGLNAGAALGLAFVIWLIVQSLYVIGALCPWCMVVWAVTIPLFWLVLAENAAAGRLFSGGTVGEVIVALRWLFILASYALVIGLIFVRWADFWLGRS